MKIRTDFITNSSSSSYVIIFKGFPEIENEVLEKYPMIKSYIKLASKLFTQNEESIKSSDDLEQYFLLHYGWSKNPTLEEIFEDEEGLKERFDNYKNKIEDGYQIYFKDVDTNDESMCEFLECLNDGENIIVEGD